MLAYKHCRKMPEVYLNLEDISVGDEGTAALARALHTSANELSELHH